MDSIRAIACAVVIFWHGFLTIVPSDPSSGQRIVSFPLGVAAREAVITFVVLSGYLLGRHWKGGFDHTNVGSKFRIYMVRRTWRIVPAFWAGLTAAILAMLLLGLDKPEGTHWDTGLPLTPERVVANYLMVTDVLGQVPLSHQLWTVPVEYHLYLLAPLIILVRRRSLALLLGVAVCLLTVFTLPDYHAPFFIFAFFAAFWAGVERQTHIDGRLAGSVKLLWPIVVLSLLLLAVVAVAQPLPTSTARYFCADALVMPVFLIWLFNSDVTASRGPLVRALGWRPLRWLGQRSYSHYLIHGFVVEVVWRFGVRPLDLPGDTRNIIAMMVAGYALSLVAGVVLYQLVERPTALKASRVGSARSGRSRHAPSNTPTGAS